MLSDLGGLISAVILVFKLLGNYINRKIIEGKFIRSLYFETTDKSFTRDIDNSCELKDSSIIKKRDSVVQNFSNIKQKNLNKSILNKISCIHFTFMDNLRFIVLNLFKKDKKAPLNDLMYLKGMELVENDLNMFNLLQRFNKIKAAVSVLVDEDDSKLKKK